VQELKQVVLTNETKGFLPNNKTNEGVSLKKEKLKTEDGYTYFNANNSDISITLRKNVSKVSDILKFYEGYIDI